MGPTLFPALSRTIRLGFVTLALEDKADEIRDLLGVTRAEMLKMDDVLEGLARQARAFSDTIERAPPGTRAPGGKLRDLGLPDLSTPLSGILPSEDVAPAEDAEVR